MDIPYHRPTLQSGGRNQPLTALPPSAFAGWLGLQDGCGSIMGSYTTTAMNVNAYAFAGPKKSLSL